MMRYLHENATQSRWLRKAKAALLLRDPVDALNDVEALKVFLERRLADLLADTDR